MPHSFKLAPIIVLFAIYILTLDLQALGKISNDCKHELLVKTKQSYSRQEVDKLLKAHGIKPKQISTTTGLDNLYAVNVTNLSCKKINSLLGKLNKDTHLNYAEPNLDVTFSSLFVTDTYNYEDTPNWFYGDKLWGRTMLLDHVLWSSENGTGAVVAVLDTGVDYNHPDLWNNIWVNSDLVADNNSDDKINLDDLDLDNDNFVDPGEMVADSIGKDFYYNDNDPLDESGHGTHLAGIIAANGEGHTAMQGIAPRAKILPIQVMSKEGLSSVSIIAQAIEYLISLKQSNSSLSNLIINNSYTASGESQVLADAFQAAHANGIVLVVAAGNNNGNSASYSPGNLSNVINVAAVNRDKRVSSFSNYGTKITVAAPGGGRSSLDVADDVLGVFASDVFSTVSRSSEILDDYPNLRIVTHPSLETVSNPDLSVQPYHYARLAGTSMAAAYASGLAALLRSKYPSYSPEQVHNCFRSSPDFDVLNYANKPVGNGIPYSILNQAGPTVNVDNLASTVSGTISISGNYTAQAGSNVAHIYINMTTDPAEANSFDTIYHLMPNASSGTFSKSVDTTAIPNGRVFFSLVVYSDDGNQSTRIIYSTVNNVAPVSNPGNSGSNNSGNNATNSAPSAPTELSASVQEVDSSPVLELTWNAATDDGLVSSYRIYKSNNLLNSVSGLTYEDTNVLRGETYTYQVSAVDNQGLESPRSSSVEISVPEEEDAQEEPSAESPSETPEEELSVTQQVASAKTQVQEFLEAYQGKQAYKKFMAKFANAQKIFKIKSKRGKAIPDALMEFDVNQDGVLDGNDQEVYKQSIQELKSGT